MPSKPHFCGLDLSLTASGLIIIDCDGVIKERKVISFPKLKGPERLNAICNEIRMTIGYYDIQLACIEGYAMRALGKTYNIGELGGVVRLLLWRLKIPYLEPPPQRVKKFATGKGGGEGGSKDQVTMFVYKHWDFQAVDNNEADAFVLAQISRGISGFGEWNAYQKEVIKEMINPTVKVKKAKKGEI